jgi:cytochrome c oxidase subunit 1
MHYLGFVGVPRRYFEMGENTFVPESAATLNEFITIVVLIVGFAQVVFIFNMIRSLTKGKLSGRNPWKATTLEWQTKDYPPGHGNFGEELPVVYRWAYEYGLPGVKDDFVPQNVAPDQVVIDRAAE